VAFIRAKYQGDPYSRTPWDEIIPGLFMGGHFYRASSGDVVPAVVGDEFDLVVSLYRRDGHGPATGIADHVREVPDAALTAAELAGVRELAELAAAAVRDGQQVLVRCHSGFNRSGLVVVQALGHLGYSIDDAIFLVRYRRSKWALNNDLFVGYLTTGLDVASLLAGLEFPG
jgi:protein-tyrosine phosphatase